MSNPSARLLSVPITGNQVSILEDELINADDIQNLKAQIENVFDKKDINVNNILQVTRQGMEFASNVEGLPGPQKKNYR